MQASIQLIEFAYGELIGGNFDLERVCADLLADCGHDGVGLSVNTLLCGVMDRDECDWHNLRFATASALARYSCYPCSGSEIARAVVAICILSHAIRRGVSDWEFSFDVVIELFFKNKNVFSQNIRMGALAIILCDGCNDLSKFVGDA